MDSLRAESNKCVAIGRQYGAEYQIFKTLKSAPPIFPDRMCSTHLQIAWIRDGEIATKHITALTGHYSNAVRSKHINRDYAWAINRTETPFTPYSLYYTAYICKVTIQYHPIPSDPILAAFRCDRQGVTIYRFLDNASSVRFANPIVFHFVASKEGLLQLCVAIKCLQISAKWFCMCQTELIYHSMSSPRSGKSAGKSAWWLDQIEGKFSGGSEKMYIFAN